MEKHVTNKLLIVFSCCTISVLCFILLCFACANKWYNDGYELINNIDSQFSDFLPDKEQNKFIINTACTKIIDSDGEVKRLCLYLVCLYNKDDYTVEKERLIKNGNEINIGDSSSFLKSQCDCVFWKNSIEKDDSRISPYYIYAVFNDDLREIKYFYINGVISDAIPKRYIPKEIK